MRRTIVLALALMPVIPPATEVEAARDKTIQVFARDPKQIEEHPSYRETFEDKPRVQRLIEKMWGLGDYGWEGFQEIAARYFERTGRQAESVEVKGSVELAPLTGLVDGIVDLTATGRTLEENGLEIVEEIASSTARLVANPVAHKLKAAAIDDLDSANAVAA
jgi:hypothetical protein